MANKLEKRDLSRCSLTSSDSDADDSNLDRNIRKVVETRAIPSHRAKVVSYHTMKPDGVPMNALNVTRNAFLPTRRPQLIQT